MTRLVVYGTNNYNFLGIGGYRAYTVTTQSVYVSLINRKERDRVRERADKSRVTAHSRGAHPA